MKWLKKAHDWWVAEGEHIKFSINRVRGMWRGWYETKDGKTFKRLPWRKTVKEMKELCENNLHWEN